VGEKILAMLNEPYHLAGHEYRNTPSIGVTLFGVQQITIDELLKQADLAMYQAKAAGRNTLRFFDTNMRLGISSQ
jgi:diguanylate cyclase (GGDEF)-like protein